MGVPATAVGLRRAVSGADPDRPSHWFEPLAEHLGSAYLRYSFTKGTDKEVDFLVDELGLGPGSRVLDVGCGPGRHAWPWPSAGSRWWASTSRSASSTSPVTRPCRAPPSCGSMPGPALRRRVRRRHLAVPGGVRPGGHRRDRAGRRAGRGGRPRRGGARRHGSGPAPRGVAAVSAFSSYFQVRYLEASDRFDADRGVNHERTVLRAEDGSETEADLWTSCFTPRELRLLARAAGLEPVHLWSVTPGDYAAPGSRPRAPRVPVDGAPPVRASLTGPVRSAGPVWPAVAPGAAASADDDPIGVGGTIIGFGAHGPSCASCAAPCGSPENPPEGDHVSDQAPPPPPRRHPRPRLPSRPPPLQPRRSRAALPRRRRAWAPSPRTAPTCPGR